jgi:hypothetical protein
MARARIRAAEPGLFVKQTAKGKKKKAKGEQQHRLSHLNFAVFFLLFVFFDVYCYFGVSTE